MFVFKHKAILICLLGMAFAPSVRADDSDWFEANGWGTNKILACLDADKRARENCEDFDSQGVEKDRAWGCASHCEGGIGDYKCEARYRCDASKRAAKTNRQLKAEGFARLPLDLNPCKAAERNANKQLREECEGLEGYIQDREVGSCSCQPLTFRVTGEPAAECDIEVSAVCNRDGERREEILSVDGSPQKGGEPEVGGKVTAVASGIDKRFTAPGDGTVIDSQTGLQWAQRDNGHNINWNDAKAHCANLKLDGGGWQLPTMNELPQIYPGAQSNKVSCGASKGHDFVCRAPSQFYLTGPAFWSSEAKGSSEAWLFHLGGGTRHSTPVSRSDLRALCVRRRS